MYLHPAFAQILAAETMAEHLRLARRGHGHVARIRATAAPVARRRVRIRGGPADRLRFRLIR